MRLKSVVKIKKKLKVEIQTLRQNEAVLNAAILSWLRTPTGKSVGSNFCNYQGTNGFTRWSTK
jgi:glucose-6-phosphate isomerase